MSPPPPYYIITYLLSQVKEINGGQSIKSKVVSFVKGQEHGDTAVVIGNKNSVSEEVP